MAEWSFFRSQDSEMRLLAITGIEETSGSIVTAAVKTTSAGTSIRPVKVRRAGPQFCDRSSRPDRPQPVADASVPDIGHPQCSNLERDPDRV